MSQLFENDQILAWIFCFGTSLRPVNLYCVLCEGFPVNQSFISGLLSSVFQTWGNMMAWNNIIQEHNQRINIPDIDMDQLRIIEAGESTVQVWDQIQNYHFLGGTS